MGCFDKRSSGLLHIQNQIEDTFFEISLVVLSVKQQHLIRLIKLLHFFQLLNQKLSEHKMCVYICIRKISHPIPEKQQPISEEPKEIIPMKDRRAVPIPMNK